MNTRNTIIFISLFVLLSGSAIYNVILNISNKSKISEIQTKSTEIKKIKSDVTSVQSELIQEKSKIQSNIMGEKNWNCKWNCTNSLLYKDFTKQTNFTNRCQEECRKELERVAAEIIVNPNFDVEKNYQIDFFTNYSSEDFSVVYKLINQHLGQWTDDPVYDMIFALNVYNSGELGYRVVPFPYIDVNDEIQSVQGLHDFYFDKRGNPVDCDKEGDETFCKAIKNLETGDRAEGMSLECGSKNCLMLIAFRTGDWKRCTIISQYNIVATDQKWIDFCVNEIKSNTK